MLSKIHPSLEASDTDGASVMRLVVSSVVVDAVNKLVLVSELVADGTSDEEVEGKTTELLVEAVDGAAVEVEVVLVEVEVEDELDVVVTSVDVVGVLEVDDVEG